MGSICSCVDCNVPELAARVWGFPKRQTKIAAPYIGCTLFGHHLEALSDPKAGIWILYVPTTADAEIQPLLLCPRHWENRSKIAIPKQGYGIGYACSAYTSTCIMMTS
jgi:hypothetical protein